MRILKNCKPLCVAGEFGAWCATGTIIGGNNRRVRQRSDHEDILLLCMLINLNVYKS